MTEKQIPSSNHWQRKNCFVSASGATLVLEDYRNTRSVDGAVTISGGRITRANVADVDFMKHVSLPIMPGTENSTFFAVVHAGMDRPQFEKDLLAPTVTGKCAIILQVSTRPSISSESRIFDSDTDNCCIWLSMKSRGDYENVDAWLSEFLSLTNSDAKKLVDAEGSREKVSQDMEEKYPHLLDIILPRTVENRLALRLLCEAWLFVEGKMTAEGITIHAPANIDEWLKPFGAKAPAEVVKQMGDAGKEAQALFTAITTGRDKAKIKTAIESFMKTFEKKQLV